jgi:hypothetical protein
MDHFSVFARNERIESIERAQNEKITFPRDDVGNGFVLSFLPTHAGENYPKGIKPADSGNADR